MSPSQEPLFAHHEPMVQFRAKDLSTFLARGGVPFSTASARIQNFAKSRWIHVRGRAGEGANSPNVYGISDVAAALMLSALQDCGVADQEVMQAASTSLYAWYNGQTPRSAHPITSALSDTLGGSEWFLQLRFLRHTQTHQRYILRSFDRADAEPFWHGIDRAQGPAWEPVGDIVIHTGSLHALRALIAPPPDAN